MAQQLSHYLCFEDSCLINIYYDFCDPNQARKLHFFEREPCHKLLMYKKIEILFKHQTAE